MKFIKASERLPEKDYNYFVKKYNFDKSSTYNTTCSFKNGKWVGYYGTWGNLVEEKDIFEWLDESIEPCATSSENYWKQRCEAAEKVSFNYMEQLKAAEAYAYMAFSKITGVMSVDEDELFNKWQNSK